MEKKKKEYFDLSICVRVHQQANLFMLDNCIYEILSLAKTGVYVQVIVYTNNFSYLFDTCYSSSDAVLLNKIVVVDGGIDNRSALINKFFHDAEGDYLSIVDYDDTIIPEAYSKALNKIRMGRLGLLFGRSFLVKYLVDDEIIYPVSRSVFPTNNKLSSLRFTNSYPIGSFIFSRESINEIVIPDMIYMEDYYLILVLLTNLDEHMVCSDKDLYLLNYWQKIGSDHFESYFTYISSEHIHISDIKYKFSKLSWYL